MKLEKKQKMVAPFMAANKIVKFTLLLLGIIFLNACQNSTENSIPQEQGQGQEHPNLKN
ncbi:hypothetical protein H4O18_17825 [Arenibacter sp. BSSL-BM3]|uniref:Lipoprotein n=1 Tax=Arenibacter arenosicollis TaxID=2762274 RepID=A0ABR7QRQ3_9FLAO|nr:hypothetical protein [Arenibacter arenosicollis]MBC8769863.1 hypothetical protein [Arenibacter arenosicollis]